MNAEQLREAASVMLAAAEGKKIQWRNRGCNSNWSTFRPRDTIVWDWSTYEFRIAPEPLECWVNVYPDGFRHYYDSKESADHFTGPIDRRIRCVHMREVEE